MRRLTRAAILLASTTLVFACSSGSDDDDDTSPDAYVPVPDAATTPDAAPTPDSAPLPDADTTDADTTDADTTDADTTDADTTDADLTDADTTDAAPACDPAGDYVEAEESTNNLFDADTAPEDSGESIGAGGTAFTIGGCIDPAEATTTEADGDFYQFTVSSDMMLRVEVTSPQGDSTTNLQVGLWSTSSQYAIATGDYMNGGSLVLFAPAAAGDYYVAVWDDLPGPPASITYTAYITESADCTTPGTADYTEANDGGNNRGNDVVTVAWATALGLTTSGGDSPEPTGLTLEAGNSYAIHGTSADVTADDDYYDRDTFAVTTGADTTELSFVLSWSATNDTDLDILVFEENTAGSFDDLLGAGTLVGTDFPEMFGMAVQPNTTYWVWVGTYSDAGVTLPVDYDIGICAAQTTWH